MKTLGLLLMGLLLAGCPKNGTTTGSDPEPDPTPPPRTVQEPEPDPTPTPEATKPSTDGRSARVVWAIVQRADESATLPEGLTSAQASRTGDLHLVHGSPRALPKDGGWSTLALLGDESAKNKIAGVGAVMAGLQAGPITGYLKLGEGAPEDPKAAVEALGAVVNTVAGDVLTVQIPGDAMHEVLGAGWVSALEVSGTVRKRK